MPATRRPLPIALPSTEAMADGKQVAQGLAVPCCHAVTTSLLLDRYSMPLSALRRVRDVEARVRVAVAGLCSPDTKWPRRTRIIESRSSVARLLKSKSQEGLGSAAPSAKAFSSRPNPCSWRRRQSRPLAQAGRPYRCDCRAGTARREHRSSTTAGYPPMADRDGLRKSSGCQRSARRSSCKSLSKRPQLSPGRPNGRPPDMQPKSPDYESVGGGLFHADRQIF
jgi:hypothetical protein